MDQPTYAGSRIVGSNLWGTIDPRTLFTNHAGLLPGQWGATCLSEGAGGFDRHLMHSRAWLSRNPHHTQGSVFQRVFRCHLDICNFRHNLARWTR